MRLIPPRQRRLSAWLLTCLIAGCLAAGPGALPVLAGETVVVAPGAALDATALEDLVRRQIAPPSDGSWAVAIVAPSLPLNNATTAPVTIELVEDPQSPIDTGSSADRVQGWLRVIEGGRPVARIPLTADLQPVVTVPVPIRALASGTVLDPTMFKDVAWPRAKLDDGILLDLANVDGSEAARRLPAGRPVPQSALQAPRLVHRGDLVMITFSRGDLRLTMTGKALEDAALGEPVQVTNPASGRHVQGRVTASGEILVGSNP